MWCGARARRRTGRCLLRRRLRRRRERSRTSTDLPRRRAAHRPRPQSRRRLRHRRRWLPAQSRPARTDARAGESETAVSAGPRAATIAQRSCAPASCRTPRRRSRRGSGAKRTGAAPWNGGADARPARPSRQRGVRRFLRRTVHAPWHAPGSRRWSTPRSAEDGRLNVRRRLIFHRAPGTTPWHPFQRRPGVPVGPRARSGRGPTARSRR